MKNWRKNNYHLGLIKAASFFISVLVALSSFCLPAHAFGDYNKAEHGTLTNTDWNNLINDFLSFNGGWVNGNVGILTSSTDTYALNVNGTINATNFIGTLTGTVNAGNISAGDFGSNTGGGNYSFPGNIGIGVTNPTWKLETNGDVNINGITLGRGPSSYTSNLAAGNSTLSVNTTGQNNTAVGYHSLIANTTGSANVALGSLALQSNNTGVSNIGIGYYALQSNTYGGSNIAIGQQSLNDNVHGDGNTALGFFSLFHNTTADLNTGLGQQALTNITSGGFNSALGFSAGSVIADGTTANQTSDHSVYLGYFTRPLANGDTNEIVIGSDVTGAGSNSAVLGNDNISKTLLKGSVGIGLTNPSAVLTLKAGTTGAGTAPLKFTTGTNMTNPESGAMEWDGSRLYMTNPSLTRQTIAYLTDIAGSFSLGALGTSPNANGMTLNNQVLNLEPASASYGGAVSTTTQTFAGAKTFSQLITGSTGLTITGGAVNLNSGSNYAINIGTGTNNQPIAIGGGSNTLAINTSGWAVSTAGALTGISGISNDGGYTQSGTSANTFTGTPTFSNATYSAFFTGGNVGIGTTTVSSAKLVIANAGTYAIDAGGFKVTNLAPAVDPPDATRLSDVMGLIHDATSTLGSQYWGQSGSNLFASSTSWNIGIGTTDPGAYKLKVAGDVAITGSLQTETGADFAEEFLTNEDLPSGTVVVMGDQGYKSVKPCTKSYDSQVVGVVSNNPSIIAGRVEGKNKAIIAMMGVVKVKVLAINGAINRGDLLVSSGIRGYAMKSQNFKVGTIIGKALEALEAPSGEINVLVNLQ